MIINSAKELTVYKKAYGLSMEIFEISKTWPVEERYSLIDQIRRSSRSVCSNLREAWAKRRYEAHFQSKLTDAASGSESLPLGEMVRTAKQIPGWISRKIVDIYPMRSMSA